MSASTRRYAVVGDRELIVQIVRVRRADRAACDRVRRDRAARAWLSPAPGQRTRARVDDAVRWPPAFDPR